MLVTLRRFSPLIVAILLLAGCGGRATPRTAPVATAPSATSVPQDAATATATPSQTPAPPTPLPTATASPTLTPSTTPPPTATPLPNARLAAGSWFQEIGDTAAARREFAALIAVGDALAPALLAEARYRLAQAYLADDAFAEAAGVLLQLLATAPEGDPMRAPAAFDLGQALLALGRPVEAEASYRAYLRQAPELAYLTWGRIGAARRAAGDLAGAAEALTAALAESPDGATAASTRRALADLALQRRDTGAALAQYDALRGGAASGPLAAEMFTLAGDALAASGDPAAAQGCWQAAAAADPTSPYAHQAMAALVQAGAPVDEYQRGLINYHNGVYALAVAAFDRYLAALLPELATAHTAQDAIYYRALSLLALGQAARGAAELERFSVAYGANPLWAEARLALARAQARGGDTDAASTTYRSLAELRPDAPQAPRALWQAVNLELGAGRLAQAADAALALGRRYPAADEGWRAYLTAGLTRFRGGQMAAAADAWGEMSTAALPSWTRPVAFFWLGRARAATGDAAAARQAWGAAVAAGPESFYGLRAAAWLAGDVAWGSGRAERAAPGAARPNDVAGERAALAAWLQGWAGEGTLDLPPALRADPDWRRGVALWALGRRREAETAWARVGERTSQPWATAALALAFRDAGTPSLAIAAAERLTGRWGGELAAAPAALQRLAYPMPYLPLLQDEAAAYGLDPRLLAAVMRQESRFQSAATSRVGAQGLMQVMPATADWIAGRLGRPGYEPEGAYLPYVNVAFGAYYLDYALDQLDGSLPAALAGYNGGPGNAARWQRLAPGDDDLMAALIDFNETRIYVQTVWAQYGVYQRLYGDRVTR